MKAWGEHLGMSIRLHFRNRMALIYGYLFPLIFLVAFWVYDMKTIRAKAITVAAILGIDLACLIVFMGVLKWI